MTPQERSHSISEVLARLALGRLPGEAVPELATAVLEAGTASVSMTRLAHGADVWVAFGDGGTVLQSDDAATWTLADPGGDFTLPFALVRGGEHFVAVDRTAAFLGVVATSTDGIAWTRAYTQPGTVYSDVASWRCVVFSSRRSSSGWANSAASPKQERRILPR